MILDILSSIIGTLLAVAMLTLGYWTYCKFTHTAENQIGFDIHE